MYLKIAGYKLIDKPTNVRVIQVNELESIAMYKNNFLFFNNNFYTDDCFEIYQNLICVVITKDNKHFYLLEYEVIEEEYKIDCLKQIENIKFKIKTKIGARFKFE